MIFHLLIVDDEAIFRKGLSQYINWETYDCVVSATAKNGTEAIDIIESTPIDIVITDVRMPSLDGIGLAKYIHENHPEISVIILSGYSEFEYARSAIQYNVAEYLLKPAVKTDVINAVQNVAKKLIESKSSISKSEQAFLKDQFFQELTDHVVPDDSLNKLSNFDINLNNYYVAAFQLPDDMSMVGTLKDIIIDNKLNSYCFRYNNLIINVYFDYETEDTSAIIDNCNTIDSSFKMFTSLNVNAGISGYHHSARDFSTAVSEAILALSLNFYSSAHVVEFSSDYVAGKETFSADINLLLHDFENSVIQLDFKSASDILGSIFNKLESNFSDENTVRSICTQIYLICYRVMLKSNTIPTEDEYINKIIIRNTSRHSLCKSTQPIATPHLPYSIQHPAYPPTDAGIFRQPLPIRSFLFQKPLSAPDNPPAVPASSPCPQTPSVPFPDSTHNTRAQRPAPRH